MTRQLKGVVNECFPSHVGMLVRSFFNAMIPAAVLNNHGYEFNYLTQKWHKHRYDSSIDANVNVATIGINDEISFLVEKIHECAGVISIEGSL